MTAFHVAQLNIARSRESLDSPALADFVAALAPINALADRSPGFIWRLQGGSGDAMGIRLFGDARLIINLSVWTSLETLGDFVYRSPHAEVMQRRRQWFTAMLEAYMVLWWIPAGEIPTLADAEDRLLRLRRDGASALAFTLRNPFPAPDVIAPR